MDVDFLVESMSNLKLPRMPKTISFGRGTSHKGWFGNTRRVEGYNSNPGQELQHKKSKKKHKEKELDAQEVMDVDSSKI